jgi:hypothetical protein
MPEDSTYTFRVETDCTTFKYRCQAENLEEAIYYAMIATRENNYGRVKSITCLRINGKEIELPCV